MLLRRSFWTKAKTPPPRRSVGAGGRTRKPRSANFSGELAGQGAGKQRRTKHVHEVRRGEKEGGGVDSVVGDWYVGE